MKEPVSVQRQQGTKEGHGADLASPDLPMEELMGFVEESIQVFSELHRMLIEEKVGILRADISGLEQRNQVKEDLLLRVAALDQRKSALWEEIGTCIQRDPVSLSLTELVMFVPVSWSETFRSSVKTLSDLMKAVRETHSGNRELILGALNLLKGSISLLTGLLHGPGVYQRTGIIGKGNQGGRLLSEAA